MSFPTFLVLAIAIVVIVIAGSSWKRKKALRDAQEKSASKTTR